MQHVVQQCIAELLLRNTRGALQHHATSHYAAMMVTQVQGKGQQPASWQLHCSFFPEPPPLRVILLPYNISVVMTPYNISVEGVMECCLPQAASCLWPQRLSATTDADQSRRDGT